MRGGGVGGEAVGEVDNYHLWGGSGSLLSEELDAKLTMGGGERPPSAPAGPVSPAAAPAPAGLQEGPGGAPANLASLWGAAAQVGAGWERCSGSHSPTFLRPLWSCCCSQTILSWRAEPVGMELWRGLGLVPWLTFARSWLCGGASLRQCLAKSAMHQELAGSRCLPSALLQGDRNDPFGSYMSRGWTLGTGF